MSSIACKCPALLSAAWRDRLPAWRLKAQQLELAGGHWTHATQAGTFQRWRDSLAEQQRQRRALARFTRATQARAWATWRSYVVERRGRQAKLQAAVNWWLRGTLCSAFSQVGKAAPGIAVAISMYMLREALLQGWPNVVHTTLLFSSPAVAGCSEPKGAAERQGGSLLEQAAQPPALGGAQSVA